MAAYFQLLGNCNNLQLIAAMARGERTVSELARSVGIKQPLASRRLALLEAGGLARSRREGKRTFYILTDPIALAVCRRVRRSLAIAAGAPQPPRRLPPSAC